MGHRTPSPAQHKKEKGCIAKGRKREAYSVLAGAGDAEVSRVGTGATAGASATGAAVPRAAKTSLARSRSGVLKVPSSILKSSF